VELLILVGIVFLQITKEKHSFFCIFIGGKKPLTFGKAKRENIRHQRLPIDRYVKYVLFNRNSILLYK
jgi:hypothetical protein